MNVKYKPSIAGACRRCDAPLGDLFCEWSLTLGGQLPPDDPRDEELPDVEPLQLAADICDACTQKPGLVEFLLENALAYEKEVRRCPWCFEVKDADHCTACGVVDAPTSG